jgi:hypothetical protein
MYFHTEEIKTFYSPRKDQWMDNVMDILSPKGGLSTCQYTHFMLTVKIGKSAHEFSEYVMKLS